MVIAMQSVRQLKVWMAEPRVLMAERRRWRKPKSESSQAINRGLVYVERPCDVSNRFAFCQQLRSNLRLVSIELARPADALEDVA